MFGVCETLDHHEPDLTLVGLRLVSRRTPEPSTGRPHAAGGPSAGSPSVVGVSAPTVATRPRPSATRSAPGSTAPRTPGPPGSTPPGRVRPLATVGGSSVLLPAERRFGTLATAAGLRRPACWPCPRWWRRRPTCRRRGCAPGAASRPRTGSRPARSRCRAACTASPGRCASASCCTSSPTTSAGSPGWPRGHRPPFPALVLLLVEAALGAEAAFALRVDYGQRAGRGGAL